jgi:hypothetical protein
MSKIIVSVDFNGRSKDVVFKSTHGRYKAIPMGINKPELTISHKKGAWFGSAKIRNQRVQTEGMKTPHAVFQAMVKEYWQ